MATGTAATVLLAAAAPAEHFQTVRIRYDGTAQVWPNWSLAAAVRTLASVLGGTLASPATKFAGIVTPDREVLSLIEAKARAGL